ncbi:MAG: SDR family NAD(P)-dependent oxidoreductase, partial [Pseudomonadota bacterium]
MAGRFEGKSIIVTGAGSGIGRASARMFAREGGKVLAVDVTEAVEETVNEIVDGNGTARALMADAGYEGNVAAMVDDAVSAHGGLDVLFANAGVSGGMASILEADETLWAETLRVNLIGPALAIKHAAPVMRDAGGGAIICTASVAGINSGAGSSHYSASKAGVMSLVKTAAQQLSGSGVRVNAICPGVVET